MRRDAMSPSTRAIHSRSEGARKNQPVTTPIYLSATFESKDVDEQISIEQAKADTFYSRYGNPTLSVAEETIAELEGTAAAAVFGSGMAAITTSLFAHLGQGDHAVFQREVYGGVHRFAYELLPRYGVDISWFDATDAAGLESAIRDTTKLVYLESPTNPTLKLVDIERAAAIAKSRGIISMIDSTFATPFNTQPHALGIDGVIHSATKYLGGHSDFIGGVIAGSTELIERVKSYMRVLGGILDPHAAYLLIRGMKSLGLRVERHNANGLEVSRFLEQHANVRAVYYPMLESFPQRELARRQMRGGGGVVSFEVDGGLDEAKRVSNALALIRIAPSLGGVESLTSIPCVTSHAMLPREEREKAGIGDGLIRLALGIEDASDLIGDLEQALTI